jgi:glycerophosphoryl diester phosphodiesterase
MLSLLAPRGRPFIVGHRGAMGHAPENTLASFARALELGVDAIELDVHLSQDGEVVVMHDEQLERTTNGRGLIRDHSLASLKTLDAGSSFSPSFQGQTIPTLAEVFELVADRVPLIVEIKNLPMPHAGIEARVLEVAAHADALERIQLISFDHPTVKRVRELNEGVATGLLYVGRLIDPVSAARTAGASALWPHWSSIQAMDVRLAHQAGVSVHPWVTSDAAIIRRLVSLDVDSIATNDPDIACMALGRGSGST